MDNSTVVEQNLHIQKARRNCRRQPLSRAEKLHLKEQKELKLIENEKDKFKNQLSREVKYTKFTFDRKSDDDWERWMSGLKEGDFKQDLKATYSDLNQLLDRKSNLIDRLLKDRQEAENQCQRNAQKHSDFLEYAMSLFGLFVNSLKTSYETECTRMLSEFHKDCTNRENIKNKQKKYYEDNLFSSNMITESRIRNKMNAFCTEKDDIIFTNIDNREKLKDDAHQIINMTKLYDQMDEIVKEIRKNNITEDKLNTFLCLNEQERLDREQLSRIRRDITNGQKVVLQLQEKLNEIQLNNMTRLTNLKYEKDYYTEYLLKIRKIFDKNKMEDKKRLLLLVLEAKRTTEQLKNYVKIGKRILSIGSICRKFQTEQEMVLPLSDNYVKEQNEITDSHLMTNMWHKISLAETHCLALTEEKKALTLENENLKKSIRKCCKTRTYNHGIATLKLSPYPTVAAVPYQNANSALNLKK